MIGTALLLALGSAIEAIAVAGFLRPEAPLLAVVVAHATGATIAALAALRAGAAVDRPEVQARGPELAVLACALALLAPPLGILAAAGVIFAAARPGRRLLAARLERYLAPCERPPAAGLVIASAVEVDRLVDDLRFGNPERRRAAVDGLAALGGRETVAPLRSALRDPDEEVRRRAVVALAAVEERIQRQILVVRDELRRAPERARAHAALGDQYAEYCYLGVLDDVTRRYYLELAVKAYARAIEIERGTGGASDAAILLAMGRALLALGRGRLAATFFEEAAAAAPRDPRPALWRAEALWREGRIGAARAACAQALALGPADGPVREVAQYWARESDRGAALPNPAEAGTAAEAEAVASGPTAPDEGPRPEELAAAARAIVRALDAPDPEERTAAFHRLLGFQSEEALEALDGAFEDAPEPARVIYCRHLARLAAAGRESVLPRLAALLEARSEALRREAALTLDAIPDAPARTDALVLVLARSSAASRAFAATALGRTCAARAAGALVRALGDRAPEVRAAAAAALGRIREPAALRAMARLIRDPSDDVRRAALLAAGEIGRVPGAGFFARRRARFEARRALGDRSARVRQAAAWAVERLGGAGAAAALAAALAGDEDERVRYEAARRIPQLLAHTPSGRRAERRARRLLPALLRAVAAEPVRTVRRAAFFAIDAIPPGPRLEALLAAVVSDDAGLRAAAAAKLGATGDRRALAPLAARLARDGATAVRTAAAQSLAAIGGAEAADALAAALGDPSEVVVYAAATALRGLGPKAALDRVAARLASAGEPAGTERDATDQALLRFIEGTAAALPPGEALPDALLAFALARLRSATPNGRYLAALALGRSRRADAAQPLLELASREPSAEIARTAAAAAGRLLGRDPRLLVDALATAGEETTPARAAALLAALAAAPPGPPASRDEIAERLLAIAPQLRSRGLLLAPSAEEDLALVLARAPARLHAALTSASGGPSAAEALRAVASLAARGTAWGDKEAIRAALDGPDTDARAAAAAALAALGDTGALPVLVRTALARRTPPQVAAAARDAVRRICSGAATPPALGDGGPVLG